MKRNSGSEEGRSTRDMRISSGRSFWKKIFYDEHRILYLPLATNVLWNFKVIFSFSRSESHSDDIPSV